MGKKQQLTDDPAYYIVEVDTLIDDMAYDDYGISIKAYSIVKVTENGAFEVDRAYRSVREALDAWPESVPPRS